MKMTGLPLVAGGLVDQPHLALMELEIVDSVSKMYKAIEQEAKNMPQAKDLMAPLFGK